MQPHNSPFRFALLLAIALIFLSVIGFYFAFPLLGIVFVMSATIWGVIVATIVVFSIALLLFFVIPGFMIFLLSGFAFIWMLLAILLFPILFPIIMPFFILLIFIAYLCKKRQPPAP